MAVRGTLGQSIYKTSAAIFTGKPTSHPLPSLFLVWLLSIMSLPGTIRNLHASKHCSKAGLLWTAGIHPKSDSSCPFPHMAYPHLRKHLAISRAFYAIVILSSTESIPHGFDICRYRCCCPIRISMVCNYRTKVLELLIFIFHRSFEPVLRIEIHHNAALVKSLVALSKVSFHNE